MQIILKELPDSNTMCLFDTRSNEFISGGCVSNPEFSELLEIANNLVRKSAKTIYNIVNDYLYDDDYGYTEAMIGRKYLDLNPDLKERAKLSINEKPVRKSKKVVVDGEVVEKVRGKSGRPKRIWTQEEIEAKTTAPKRGRGRPKRDPSIVMKPVVLINGLKRKRGRPPKVELLTMTV